MGPATVAQLRVAVESGTIRAAYARMIATAGVGPTDCLLWAGAVSGRGHGRFWIGRNRVVIAHRFGYALAHGVDGLLAVPVLEHGCDNPLCQRIGPGHVIPSTKADNERSFTTRRHNPGNPLRDTRGSKLRAVQLRNAARNGDDPAAVAVVAAQGVSLLDRDQLVLPLD